MGDSRIANMMGKWRALVSWSNVAWQMVHLATGGVLLLGLWMVLARVWGPDRFGWFNYLFVIVAVSGIAADFGLEVLLTRFVAGKNRWIASPLLHLKLLVGAVILAAGMVVSLWLPGDFRGAFRLLLLGVAALSGTSFLNGLLRGIDRLDVEAKIGLVQKVLFAGGSAAGVWAGEYGPGWVGFCYLGSHIVAFGLTSAWLARRSLLLVRASGGGSLRTCFYQAGPLVVVALLIFLALRLDVFLLQWLAGPAAVGVYAAAFRYVEGWVMVTTAYLLALFPRLVAEKNKKSLRSGSAKRSAHLLAGGGFLAALITWWLAPYVTTGLLGASFAMSNRVLRGLVVVLPLLFLTMLWGQALIAHGRQQVYALVLLLGTLVSVAVDCWTIPRWGAWGAVVGVWVRESFQFAVLAGYVVRRGNLVSSDRGSQTF